MKKKDKNKIIILLIIGLSLISFVGYKIINKHPSQIIKNYNPLYDYSTREKAVGASDYVFIGKVNKILRIEHDKKINKDKKIEYNHQTIYSVNVIKNIKRKLITDMPIEIKFDGGYDMANNTLYLNKGMNLLNPEKYYIFLVYMDLEHGPLWLSNQEQIVDLGNKYNEDDSLIKNYVKAYKNEEVPDVAKYIIPKTLFTSIYDINYELKK